MLIFVDVYCIYNDRSITEVDYIYILNLIYIYIFTEIFIQRRFYWQLKSILSLIQSGSIIEDPLDVYPKSRTLINFCLNLKETKNNIFYFNDLSFFCLDLSYLS